MDQVQEMMHEALTIYVGFDSRERDAFDVCKASILRHASEPVRVVKLDQAMLRYIDLYDRPYSKDNGQMTDGRDGRPFSTQFAFSRFLIPVLNLYEGHALFCDCDFLFTSDVCEIMKFTNDRHAVSVVKHNYEPQETVKMDGQVQTKYPRKNWSSFVLWNCAHALNRALTIRAVNWESGSWLHGFDWLADASIGALPRTWNHLSGVSEDLPDGETPKAIHFTLDIPRLKGYENSPYAELWNEEYRCLGLDERKPSKFRVVA